MEIIYFTGEMSRHNQQGIWRLLTPVLDRRPQQIMLDFSGVQYMAISCIAVLIDLLIKARQQSIRVSACGLSDSVLDLITLSNLSEYMEISSGPQNTKSQIN